MSIPYHIPPDLLTAYMSGAVRLIGATLRDSTTGRIVGHVQQTGALDGILANFGGLAADGLSIGFPPLGVALKMGSLALDGFQSHQLHQIGESLALLQGMQVATLGVSGLDLGVSAVGFALVLKKLAGLEAHLKAMDQRIDKVTTDRRQDEIGKIFIEIRRCLQEIDALPHYGSARDIGLMVRDRLLTRAGDLEHHYRQRLGQLETSGLSLEDLDHLWTLAGALSLCHGAAATALFEVDELAAARATCLDHASGLLELAGMETADGLARLHAGGAASLDDFHTSHAAALVPAQKLIGAIRAAATAMASRSELADTLIRSGTSGPAYMAAVRAEQTQPLLFLPAG